jgi:hypothetical protein
MNPKDTRTDRPVGGELTSPSPDGDPPPRRDQDTEEATVPERPAMKQWAPAPPPASAPAAPSATADSTWSPSDCPGLVFAWSVIRTDDPAVLRFPTKVYFYATGGAPDTSVPDPQALLVSTALSSDRRRVTFSVSGESGVSPFLSGTLNYEPGAITASLTVTDLRYPGNFIARQVLYPSP